MRTLVIDVGGTHVKLLATGKKSPVTFESGPDMTPKKMVLNTLQSVNGWKFDNVSIGYPVRSLKASLRRSRLTSGAAGFALISKRLWAAL